MAEKQFVLSWAGASLANTRDREHQDRFAIGQDVRGAWAVVADGIGGGELAAESASLAVAITVRSLATGPLDEQALAAAADLSHAAVQALFQGGATGGTTLTIAAVTTSRLMLCSVGDSPAFLVHHEGLKELTPLRQQGPLRRWVGAPGPFDPWVGSVAIQAGVTALITSDGVDPYDVPELDPNDPHGIVDVVLKESRNGDDATALAVTLKELRVDLYSEMNTRGQQTTTRRGRTAEDRQVLPDDLGPSGGGR